MVKQTLYIIANIFCAHLKDFFRVKTNSGHKYNSTHYEHVLILQTLVWPSPPLFDLVLPFHYKKLGSPKMENLGYVFYWLEMA